MYNVGFLSFCDFWKLISEFVIGDISETQKNRSLNPTYKFYGII